MAEVLDTAPPLHEWRSVNASQPYPLRKVRTNPPDRRPDGRIHDEGAGGRRWLSHDKPPDTFTSPAVVIAAAALALVATSAGVTVRGPARQRHSERHATSPVIIDSVKRGAFGMILVTKRGYTL
jgi:hypothetical protein